MDELCQDEKLNDFWSDLLSKVGEGTDNKISSIVDKVDKLTTTAEQGISQVSWIIQNGKPYFIAFGALVVAKLITGITHDIVEIKNS